LNVFFLYHLKLHHFLQHKTLIDPNNIDMVHHLVFFACNPTAKFDDNNLPHGVRDEHYQELSACFTGTSTIWAVGGEPVRLALSKTQFQVQFRE
jgi:hypothetical protein